MIAASDRASRHVGAPILLPESDMAYRVTLIRYTAGDHCGGRDRTWHGLRPASQSLQHHRATRSSRRTLSRPATDHNVAEPNEHPSSTRPMPIRRRSAGKLHTAVGALSTPSSAVCRRASATRAPQAVACAARADFSVGRRDWWMSSLDRGPEVSDGVRCDPDIGAVRRERPAAEIPDECRCSLRS